MADQIEGGCACGAIRYLCTGTPIASFNCHCRSCQRFSGSAFMSGVVVPADTFRLTRGEPTYYVRAGGSGGEISRGFCAKCGSPVTALLSRMPVLMGIAASSLDDPASHKPMFDMFTAEAQPWDHMDPNLPKFPGAPPLPQ